MLDDVLDTVRRLALAGFLILLLGIGIGTAASYGLMVRPALRDLEVLYADVARLENELAQCRADAAAGAAALEACVARGDPVEEYYRGAYDVCVAVLGLGAYGDCLDATGTAYENDRHQDSSYRWRWLPDPEPEPMPDREVRRW